MDLDPSMILLIFMLGIGVISGIFMSISLGRKVTDKGGILGGLLVAFLMWVLTGGFSY